MPGKHPLLTLSATAAAATIIWSTALPNAHAQSGDLLKLEEARHYMVDLINRDRATLSLKPVVLDETASHAGQQHTDEMAQVGYLSHWSLDGKKPDQRYTEAGGTGYDMENAHIGFEGDAYTEDQNGEMVKLKPAAVQVFRKDQLEHIEAEFFNEKAPMDGHRKNIIDPIHTGVGIGLSLASEFGRGSRMACCQEFVNIYGEFAAIPAELKLGETLTIKGILQPDVEPFSIDLRWEDFPKPMTSAELRKTYSYGPPGDRVVTCFVQRPPFPIKLNRSAQGNEIELSLPTNPEWKPGEYSIFVWARLPDSPEPRVISLRTIALRK
ncbi:MAG TPA: CAP domain-containing protein [Chroococcales cyanobacterium]